MNTSCKKSQKSNEKFLKSVDLWPKNDPFPILDIVRIFLKNPKVSLLFNLECLSSGKISDKFNEQI